MFNHIKVADLPDIIQKNLPNGKRFYVTPEGKEYPSITTVLGSRKNEALEKWRAAMGDKKAQKEMERCAKRGTIIHDLAEKYLKNQELNFKNIAPSHKTDFIKLKFQLNKINNIRCQEKGLYSDELKIAGTVDCIAEYNGELSVIDFKTSTNSKDKNIIDNYFKQCTAYAICWKELTGELVENITILMSVENGLFPLVFKDTIYNWIKPLIKDINNFYKTKDIK